MNGGFGIFVFSGIIFIAWLMWSSKVAKEKFLFYAWAAMIAMSALQLVPILLK